MSPRKAAAPADPNKKPRKPRRKKVDAASKGLSPQEVATGGEAAALIAQLSGDGGVVLANYREPMGAHPVLLAALPIEKVEPTPYQRDVSETHVKRLMNAMERVGRFLDPIIAVRHDGVYWTPNGNHRLTAARTLGHKSIVALVVPEEEVAYQILALNTEKAHNLKERSLEVIRMYRGLVGARGGEEKDYAEMFEEPSFITLGAAYEKRPRYSAGAYNPIVKRLEAFLDGPLEKSLKVREARADKLLQFDDEVVQVVDALKARGLVSPYLKNFVVARLNFLRFKKGGTFDFDETIDKMREGAKKFDSAKVNKEDLSRMGGAPAEAVEE